MRASADTPTGVVAHRKPRGLQETSPARRVTRASRHPMGLIARPYGPTVPSNPPALYLHCMHTRRFVFSLAISALLACASCSSSTSTTPTTVTQTIGPEGGAIVVDGATVTFPKDA